MVVRHNRFFSILQSHEKENIPNKKRNIFFLTNNNKFSYFIYTDLKCVNLTVYSMEIHIQISYTFL